MIRQLPITYLSYWWRCDLYCIGKRFVCQCVLRLTGIKSTFNPFRIERLISQSATKFQFEKFNYFGLTLFLQLTNHNSELVKMAQIFTEKPLYEVTKVKNDNGGEYEVGKPAGSSQAIEAADVLALKFNVACQPNWQPGSDWTSLPSSFTAQTGITRYWIKEGGIWYKYRINFTINDAGVGTVYKFWDASPDFYICTTGRAGDHYIDYNSSNPKMTSVESIP